MKGSKHKEFNNHRKRELVKFTGKETNENQNRKKIKRY